MRSFRNLSVKSIRDCFRDDPEQEHSKLNGNGSTSRDGIRNLSGFSQSAPAVNQFQFPFVGYVIRHFDQTFKSYSNHSNNNFLF